jgi:hypothetical protein
MKLRTLVMAGVLAASCATAAHANTIDFSGFASGDSGLSTLALGDVTFSVPGGTIYVYRPGDFGAFATSGGLCALTGHCETDWTLSFAYTVTNLAFEAAFYQDFDSVVVSAFDGATLVGSVHVASDGAYDFGAAHITSLVFDDSSTGDGFGFGDFSFDPVSAPVPEPATLLLLGSGLCGAAYRRRR